MKIKIIKLKKETPSQTDSRIKELCINKDINKGMDAQVALNELSSHILGEDWYIVDPVNNVQGNAIIVYAIERKFKKYV
jgi:hypothetical protein